jgi:rod shape-determining protein MreC
MGRLLELIAAYRNFLFFLLLECISLWLLAAFNDAHQSLTREVSLSVAARVQEMRDDLTRYLHLTKENERMMGMNMDLQRQVNALRTELNTYKYRIPYRKGFTVLPDSLIRPAEWRFIPCRVIHSTLSSQYNYLTLNAGANQGVSPEMGIVTADGVAGIVITVNDNYSLAMSVLNKDCKLYAKIKGRDIFGTLTWEGERFDRGKLAYVPQHFVLNVGDTVITSGYGSIFPEGIYVGRVTRVEPDEQGAFYDIDVQLGADFFRMDNVYLIQQRDKTRIDSLLRNRLRGTDAR